MQALALPLMTDLRRNPQESYYILAYGGSKSGVNHAVDPEAWSKVMALESDSALTYEGPTNTPLLHLRNGRTNNVHPQGCAAARLR
jgi:hypothetical protein